MPDDPTILDDWRLLRRIPPNQIVWDKNMGGPRPSSANFRDPQLSIDIEPVLVSLGLEWYFTLDDYPGFSLVAVTARQARTQGQAIIRSPVPDVDMAHGEIVGAKPRTVGKAFSNLAEWVYLAPFD